ncbi:hypothetical protein [Solimonas variicoloris]|uniref:hypothetical protein n=1 Tax=Solimonas variicoloris TaxID=254408 RepID=UPI0012B5FE51|nr:hypothetical protein [Solimonas variicoloris]
MRTSMRARRHGGMATATILLAAVSLGFPSPSASNSASDTLASIAGIWHTDVRKFMADAIVYFVLDPDSSCKQVVKISLVGLTKWTARSCTWRLDGNLLTLSLEKSAASEEEKDNLAQITVAEVTRDSLLISSGGKVQRWMRAEKLPPDFAVRLQAASTP